MGPPRLEPVYDGAAPPAEKYPEPVQALADPAMARDGIDPPMDQISYEAPETISEPSLDSAAPPPPMPPEPEVQQVQTPAVSPTVEEGPSVQQTAEE